MVFTLGATFGQIKSRKRAAQLLVRIFHAKYVRGYGQGLPVVFTAVSAGAIISRKVYQRLAEAERGLSSSPLAAWTAVADIEDEALLGYDILAGNGNSAPADLRKSIIVIHGMEIPCVKRTSAIGCEGLQSPTERKCRPI